MPDDRRWPKRYDAETLSETERRQVGGLSDAGNGKLCRGADLADAWIREATNHNGVGARIADGIDKERDHLGHVFIGLDPRRCIVQFYATDPMPISLKHPRTPFLDRVIAFELLGLITSISAKCPSNRTLRFDPLIFLVIYYEICHVEFSLLTHGQIRGRKDEFG